MRLKSLFTLLTLVFIALLIWWFQLVDNRTADLLFSEEKHFVDAYMRDFKLTSMNSAGKTGFTLRAREFNHFNDSDIATLKQPVLHLLQDQSGWQLSAERGEINDAQSKIVLQDTVVMQQIPSPEVAYAEIHLLTERLDIDTTLQLATTELPVQIEYNTLSLHTRGMRLDNLKGQLELLAEVTGVYVRP